MTVGKKCLKKKIFFSLYGRSFTISPCHNGTAIKNILFFAASLLRKRFAEDITIFILAEGSEGVLEVYFYIDLTALLLHQQQKILQT